MNGWGWVEVSKKHFKDCLQQSKSHCSFCETGISQSCLKFGIYCCYFTDNRVRAEWNWSFYKIRIELVII